MKLETFRGRDLNEVFDAARRALGEDVMILRTDVERVGRTMSYVVVATAADHVERFRRRLTPQPLPAGRGRRPVVIALVGPTGAGKTTTAVKLALNPGIFGGRKVGLITLDTYRAGAIEQLGMFSEIADLPLEVVYHTGDVADAMKRLDRCDVILVDTPGHRPRSFEMQAELGALLDMIQPDEVHLTLPATLRVDLVAPLRQSLARLNPTHLLVTKLDEVPGEAGLADLALAADLPARWVGDGQEVPDDVRPATGRITATLGALRGAA